MKLREVHYRWMGIPLLAIIAMFADKEHLAENPIWYVYFVSFCFCAIYWNGAWLIIRYFRRKFPEISKTGRRLLLSGLFILIWMSVGGTPFKILFGVCTVEESITWDAHKDFIPFNFIAATVICLAYEAFYFFDKWKETFRLNEELKNQQIRTQYEVLQNQMSPHFLFNSLNTLTTIIAEDQKNAIKFTEKLSEVYRYILHNKDRELVTLKDELEFVKAYLFLLSIRYPDNLSIAYNISPKYDALNLPPLTLQMLVENAIKHNIISKSKPLHIEVYVENGKSVIVKNNLQKKEVLEKSTKTGLENIRKRYGILGGWDVDIITSANNFMVAVPLIDVLKEKDLKLA